MQQQRRLLLITGIPGTGKTSIGEHLQAEHGFLHVNREEHSSPQFTSDPAGFLAGTKADVVATWGFRPKDKDDLAGVDQLVRLGFRGVWFDGSRPAALRHFLEAKPEQEWEFYLQMFNIETSGIVGHLGFVKIDPFTSTGDFRPFKEVASALMKVLE